MWQDMTGERNDEKAVLLSELREMEKRLTHLRGLLAEQKLEVVDYTAMKADILPKLERAKARLVAFPEKKGNFEGLLSQGVAGHFRLDRIYEEGGVEKEREVIGSIFPGKLTFDGFVVRTGRMNEVAELLFKLGAGLEENKKGQKSENSLLSCDVTRAGFKPETF